MANEADGAPGRGGRVERHLEVPLQSRDLALNDVGNGACVVIVVVGSLFQPPLLGQRRQRDLGTVDGLSGGSVSHVIPIAAVIIICWMSMGGILDFYGKIRRAMKTQILPIQHVIFPVQDTQNHETDVKEGNSPEK